VAGGHGAGERRRLVNGQRRWAVDGRFSRPGGARRRPAAGRERESSGLVPEMARVTPGGGLQPELSDADI
jgi:hypothetical protein